MIPGAIPALPLHTAGKYVAGAYIVLFAIVLVYVAIMAARLSRTERELAELLSEHSDEHTPVGGAGRLHERELSPPYPEGHRQ